jgi:poly(glycerol-phosphate) alpha-glucosyltransferase
VKVSFVLSSLSRANGGVSESVRRLAQSLAGSGGVTPSAFGLQDAHTAEDAPLWRPVTVEAFPVRGPRAIGYAPGLSRALDTADPDVVHAAGLWMYPSIVSRRRHRRSGRPYLISPHGMLDPWALRNAAWKKRIASIAYERAHLEGAACLHALCEAEARAIRGLGLTNPICVLPNGVDLPRAEAPATPAPWAGRVPEGTPVLLFLGRLHPKKGLLPLLHAWAGLRNAQWHLAIAGWDQGDHQRELAALVAAHGMERRVSFLGPLHGDPKEAAYRAASAFILPSFSEGLPMTVLEAWAHGLPVLMTPACNLPEGFAAGAALEISTEPEALAAGLRRFFQQDASARAAMGMRARALAETDFNWARIAARMADVYRWVRGDAACPPCVRGGR